MSVLLHADDLKNAVCVANNADPASETQIYTVEALDKVHVLFILT